MLEVKDRPGQGSRKGLDAKRPRWHGDRMTSRPKPEPKQKLTRRTIRVKHSAYQPSRAELREDVCLDATPEELARAVLRPVRVIRDPDA